MKNVKFLIESQLPYSYVKVERRADRRTNRYDAAHGTRMALKEQACKK
jgi:hypothetical protein